MVDFTEKAADKIKEIAQQKEFNPIVRAGVKGSGCAGFQYVFYFEDQENLKETDEEITKNGVKLIVDQMSLMYLEDVNIDWQDGLMQSGFKFNNPQVSSVCGCGNSFSA